VLTRDEAAQGPAFTAERSRAYLPSRRGVNTSRKPGPIESAFRQETPMKIKAKVRAGGENLNHNQILVRGAKTIKVKSGIRAGGEQLNHNQTIVLR
jgi:hypothetical protein